MLKLSYVFGHVLIVDSRCYGRCYVKKLKPLCTFFEFHTHLEENSARSFQNVFYKKSGGRGEKCVGSSARAGVLESF